MTKNSICDDILRQKALRVGRSWQRFAWLVEISERKSVAGAQRRREGGRKWGRACGHSRPLWVNGGGLLLKEGYGWVTERSEGHSGGEKSPGPLLTVPGLERTSMFRKWCLDKCQWGWGGGKGIHVWRKVRGDPTLAGLKFKMLEFEYYLTDISESWKVFNQVMGEFRANRIWLFPQKYY